MQELLSHAPQVESVFVIILAVTSFFRWLEARAQREDNLERSISGKPSMRTDLDAFMAATKANLEEIAANVERMRKKASDYGDEQQKQVERIEKRIMGIDSRANRAQGDFRVFRARTDEKMRSIFTLLGQRHEEDHKDDDEN